MNHQNVVNICYYAYMIIYARFSSEVQHGPPHVESVCPFVSFRVRFGDVMNLMMRGAR